ncbi:MAG: hypothetical protein Q3X95_09345, partial [Duodenibacillus sp.]|nr:hypothetical protein [Duodenibacillus sp.]
MKKWCWQKEKTNADQPQFLHEAGRLSPRPRSDMRRPRTVENRLHRIPRTAACIEKQEKRPIKKETLLICKRLFFPGILVGAAGFELATPCTPCKCATRLR